MTVLRAIKATNLNENVSHEDKGIINILKSFEGERFCVVIENCKCSRERGSSCKSTQFVLKIHLCEKCSHKVLHLICLF